MKGLKTLCAIVGVLAVTGLGTFGCEEVSSPKKEKPAALVRYEADKPGDLEFSAALIATGAGYRKDLVERYVSTYNKLREQGIPAIPSSLIATESGFRNDLVDIYVKNYNQLVSQEIPPNVAALIAVESGYRKDLIELYVKTYKSLQEDENINQLRRN